MPAGRCSRKGRSTREQQVSAHQVGAGWDQGDGAIDAMRVQGGARMGRGGGGGIVQYGVHSSSNTLYSYKYLQSVGTSSTTTTTCSINGNNILCTCVRGRY